MSALVPLPIVLPLLGAAVSIIGGRSRAWQRAVTLVTLAAVLVISVLLLVEADDKAFVVHEAGGWPAPLGVSLMADRLATMMLVTSAIVLFVVAVYAMGQPGEEQARVAFHPLYLVLASGVAASFLTADLFNLFVAFEMMLAASYVLITLGGRPDQVRSGMSYVVISLVASTLFITVLALLYMATGTVNMADLAVRLADVDESVRAAFALVLFVVFGIKAGVFPLFFWLPDSYPTAPGPVTAIFAGLLTKVGVYAIIRTQTLMFEPTEWMGQVIIIVAVLTMIIGGLGAIAQDDMKRILAFHIVSQIGYMIFGLGLFTVAGVAGAIIYVINNMLVKTVLFLVAGVVERRAGSSRLSEIGGLVRGAPFVALLFAVSALSLAGLPPFSGFVAKLAVIDAGIEAASWIGVAGCLLAGVLTLFSMLKIWSGVFWGSPDETPGSEPIVENRLGGPVLMVGATAVLAAVSLAVALAAGPLLDMAVRSGEDLMARDGYIEAILGEAP